MEKFKEIADVFGITLKEMEEITTTTAVLVNTSGGSRDLISQIRSKYSGDRLAYACYVAGSGVATQFINDIRKENGEDTKVVRSMEDKEQIIN